MVIVDKIQSFYKALENAGQSLALMCEFHFRLICVPF